MGQPWYVEGEDAAAGDEADRHRNVFRNCGITGRTYAVSGNRRHRNGTQHAQDIGIVGIELVEKTYRGDPARAALGGQPNHLLQCAPRDRPPVDDPGFLPARLQRSDWSGIPTCHQPPIGGPELPRRSGTPGRHRFAPVYRGELGIDALNEALRDRLNQDGRPVRGGRLRVGDKLMMTGRNLHDLGLMNGTVLRLLDETDGRRARRGRPSPRRR